MNVAQRVAGTFCRVYARLGVQQHEALRRSVLDAFRARGILPEKRHTWSRAIPSFDVIRQELEESAELPSPQGRIGAGVASHISTMFVFNTFQDGGTDLSWATMLQKPGGVFGLRLNGLEPTLERAVKEFLLWNLIGFIEAAGPGGLRCFIVLDEAHRLSFSSGSRSRSCSAKVGSSAFGSSWPHNNPKTSAPWRSRTPPAKLSCR